MKNIKLRVFGLALLVLVTIFNYSSPVLLLKNTPSTVYYTDPDTPRMYSQALNSMPLITGNTASVASSGDERLNNSISVSLFGVVPVKEIEFVKKENVVLVPSGHSIGISIRTRGLLVVDTSDIVTDAAGTSVKSPAFVAGIRPGDIITHADGHEINTARELSEYCDDSVNLRIIRDGQVREIRVNTVLDTRTDTYRLGIWVREDTAGIGTLSYYNPEDGTFAALGHAVTDVDTGTVSDIKDGRICSCDIISIDKGASGAPGEMVGIFHSDTDRIGRLIKNTEYGIYGEDIDTDGMEFAYPEGLYMAYPDEVHTGDALLLCSPDGKAPRAYSCRIVKASPQSAPSVKGIIVEVTDENLIARTGGIVQGMSGSPIIQDNKLVGVVTHVMISNPLRGYGVYACWMWEKGAA